MLFSGVPITYEEVLSRSYVVLVVVVVEHLISRQAARQLGHGPHWSMDRVPAYDWMKTWIIVLEQNYMNLR